MVHPDTGMLLTTERNELLIYIIWMNLKSIMLNGRSQIQKASYVHMILFRLHFGKGKATEIEI